ncbi:MAG: WS/DGAT/MGAT family O-acyltransferase [Acidimicrobiales bacterium]
MERLSGLDASFLYTETPTLHMHTLKYALLDMSDVEGGFTLERFRQVLADRLHLLPAFRRRLVEVPLGLHHAVWIDDPDFDLAAHVRRVGVPFPGGRREMDELIGQIASWPLDRRRPLWEIWVLEGLADDLDDPAGQPPSGRTVGFLAKIHHSVADGVAAAAMLANVMSTSPEGDDAPAPGPPWYPESPPSAWRLLVDAVVDAVRNLRRLPALLLRTTRALRAVARRRKHADVSPPLPVLHSPRTPFNAALTPHRSFATAELSFDDARRVKSRFGVTLNDVVLAMAAGAVRAHLEDLDALPARPLVASVPTSVDGGGGGGTRLSGNRVSNLFTSLRTDLADPVERLLAISEVTRAAKEVQQLMGSELLLDWSEFTPPRLAAWAMRQYSRLRLADRHRPPINLIVSNVPGPREALYVAGGRLEGMWSVGPILEGVGLNITVWSYGDRLFAGLLACPEQLSDLHSLAARLPLALAELVARSDEPAAVPARSDAAS